MNTSKVSSIKLIGSGVVRNLTVYGNHTFVTENGIVTHNCDHLLPDTQAAMRNAIEHYSKNCKFIFTANYPDKLSKALHSRLPHIKFDPTKEELMQMQAKFFMRVSEILNHESITFDDKVLVNIVQRMYPDCRKILGELQLYGRGGAIDEGIFVSIKELNISDFVSYIKAKDFKQIRQWVANNSGSDTSGMYDKLYTQILDKKLCKSDSIPVLIMAINDYQRYDHVVPSKEVHLSALAVQLMMEIEWN